jgi:diacylglycerol kinase family enzyme
LPVDGVVVRSDAQARAIVERARRANDAVPPLGLLGGDLCHALGGTGDEARLRSPEAVTVPVDVGAVLIDGRLHWFVAHLVARKGWWRGPIYAAMNAQHVGSWDVAPRSHPNDGKLDTFVVTMPMGERLKARGRLRTGTHVPHAGIEVRQVPTVQWDIPSLDVWLDGEKIATGVHHLSIRTEPDALTCVV